MNLADFIERPVWAFRQLLPLPYATTCTVDGERKSCHWWMWFGRCFAVKWSAAETA